MERFMVKGSCHGKVHDMEMFMVKGSCHGKVHG